MSDAELQTSAVPEFEIESVTPNLEQIDAFPQSVSGESFTVTVRLNRPAPAGGLGFAASNLFPFSPIVSFPAVGAREYRIPAGEQETDIVVETVPATRSITDSITLRLRDPDPAVGELGRDSSESFFLRLVPNPERPVQLFEAEDARLRGATSIDDVAFGDGAAVNYTFGSRSRVTFEVDVDEAGTYELVLAYAELLGSPTFGDEHFATLNVNGDRTRLRLGSAGGVGNANATKLPVEVTLEEGRNVIRVVSQRGGFALDKLELSPR